MSISHHPSEEMLLLLANGRLDLGRCVVVAAHVESCAECARRFRVMEAVGGVMLRDAAPVAMADDALALAMSRLDGVERFEPAVQDLAVSSQAHGEMPYLPEALGGYRMGAWEWIGPGIHRRMVEVPDETGARVFLLKAAPGTRMPDHTHTGTELTLVLSGAFSHAGGHYGPGDLDEADDTVDHQPIVDAGEVCVCLVAMQGSLRLKGMAGRLLQPFVRI